jgi:hypothetical protein
MRARSFIAEVVLYGWALPLKIRGRKFSRLVQPYGWKFDCSYRVYLTVSFDDLVSTNAGKFAVYFEESPHMLNNSGSLFSKWLMATMAAASLLNFNIARAEMPESRLRNATDSFGEVMSVPEKGHSARPVQ